MIINRFIPFLLVFFITLCIIPSQAQELLQKKSTNTDSSTQKLLQSPLLESTYHLAKGTSPLLLEQVMGKQISITSLRYQTENGKFRPYQDPEHSKAANFSAQGGKKLAKMLLWGSFSYSNNKLDSIRWGHRKDSEFSTPFYYGSQRAVHYQQTDYAIQTHLVHQIISGFSGSLSGDYGMGDHFSTNDPRAALKHFKLRLTPALQWKNQHLGVEIRGLWGYGQQESQVDYRNKEYYESSQYPEYLNWFINGYGTMRNALSFSDRVYTNNQDFSGAGFAFYYKSSRWRGQANINYERIHEEYDRGNSSGRYDGYDMYGDYDVNQWKGYIEAHDVSLRWGFRLLGSQSKGKDYNIDLLGNNYASITREGTLQIYYSQPVWGRNTQFSFEQKLNYHNQVDGNMLIKRAAGRQSALFKLNHQLDQHRSRLLELGFGIATPYGTEFNQSPRSSNDFIDQVIKHDVALDKASFWHIQGGLQQYFNFTGMNWMAHIHTKQIQSTSTSEILSGKSRNQTTLSLHLYF
ncbi:DUF6850 family outer membrane beta-barrel protein [Sphingobacterium sp. MYb388]|uniref:DUF6850 family outer membrane beta-barrel protein n=1 Tax=Sphingobacterium sp. MYb388 TaxID=2745437 RepID=UPI0030A09433